MPGTESSRQKMAVDRPFLQKTGRRTPTYPGGFAAFFPLPQKKVIALTFS